ncbi:MAG: PEP-CTERM system TPR-repeat protein PrsT [Gammaproteobacteria bacterium]|nr:MAG: PEP-CTERM system TPR-repeat protein PrsT [Gammaproteobacteria bacterium]
MRTNFFPTFASSVISICGYALLPLLTMISLAGCGLIGGSDPAEHIEKSKLALADGDVDSAILELKSALQQDPEYGEARWLLGGAYIKAGDGISAVKELEQAQALGFSDPLIKTFVLEALILQGGFQQVLDETANLDASIPANSELLAYRGYGFFGLGNQVEAENALAQALQLNPESITARLGLARLALVRQDFVQAGVDLEEASKISPEDPRIWYRKGELELLRKDPVAAEAAFNQAISLAGYDMNARLGLTSSLLLQKKYSEAEEALASVLRKYPNHPTARYYRAYITYQSGDVERTKDMLLGILKDMPDHSSSLLLISEITFKQGNLEQTIEYLSRFIAIAPDHLDAVKLLVQLYLGEGNTEKAIVLLEQTAARHKDAEILALLGSAYLQSGEPDKGSSILGQAIEIAPDSADIRTQLAMGLLASGSLDAAVTELETAVELNPDLIRADVLLVMSNLRSKDNDKALDAATKLLNKHPDEPLPLNLLGEVHAIRGDHKQARSLFERALQADASFKPALSNLALLDVAAKDLISAEARYQKILSIDEHDENALIRLAWLEEQRGNEEKMRQLLENARVYNDKALAARLVLGRYYYRKRDAGNMLRVMNEAKEIDANNTDVLFLLGQAQLLNGMHAEALATLKLVAERNPDQSQALVELTQAQLLSGDAASAKQTLNQVLSAEPENLPALLTAIQLAIKERRYQDARLHLAAMRKSYPESLDLDAIEGDIYYNEGDMKLAIIAYRKAEERNNTRETSIKLASALLNTNANEEAWQVLNSWLAQHPDDQQAQFALAAGYQQGRNQEQAAATYELILSRDPTDARALNNLAWLYLESNDPRKAEAYAERAYKANPNRPEIIDTYGWVLVKQNQSERGLELLQTALAAMPDNPDLLYHVAAARYASGDKGAAIKELEDLIERHKSFETRSEAEKLLSSLK